MRIRERVTISVATHPGLIAIEMRPSFACSSSRTLTKKLTAVLDDPYAAQDMGMYLAMDPTADEMTANTGALVGEARRSLCAAWKRTTGPIVLIRQWSSNSLMGVVARGP